MRAGREFEQPADLVLVTAFSLNNVRMLLLSGIGKPYDPGTGKGVVGRNYAYPDHEHVAVVLRRGRQHQSVHGVRRASGTVIDDFTGDNFDHAALGFIGGAYHRRGHDRRPADRVPPDAARHARAGARTGSRRSHGTTTTP